MCCTRACIKCLALLKNSGSFKVNQITVTPFLKYKTFYNKVMSSQFIYKNNIETIRQEIERVELLLWCEVLAAGSL